MNERLSPLEVGLTERDGAVERLRESEERLRTLLENSPDFIMLLDAEATILYLNRALPSFRVENLVGRSAVAAMEHDQAAIFLRALAEAIETGEPRTVETASHRWWQTRLVPLQRTGAPRVMGIGTDITERRRTEAALTRSNETLRIAVQAAGMGLWSWDLDTNTFLLDSVSAGMLGYPEGVAGVSLEAVIGRVHPDDQAAAARASAGFAESGELAGFECRVLHPDGSVRWLLVSGRRAQGRGSVTLIGAVFDVTERRRLEEQLRQSQKMEAVGQLTAGIAHNFNNLLAAIIPSVQLARREVPGPAGERLQDAEYAATRAAELVRQLMVFARHRRILKKEPVDVGALMRRTIDICRATFDRSIAVDVIGSDGLPLVLGEAGQIEQVLLNVCLNARDALESAPSSDRRLVARLDVVQTESPATAPVSHVRVRISDNGPGMSEAVRARVFEPFFTTKDVGRGSGLGLATAYAIATDHGGRLSCESTPGEGATFTLLLPVAAEPASSSVPLNPTVSGGKETVLVIDDERLVRKAVRSVLEPAGYRVLDAADGIAGFELFQREPVDLVLLDLSMPGIPGDSVLASMLKERPETRVVLFTGYRADALPAGARAILQKPVQIDELLRVVREVCDQ